MAPIAGAWIEICKGAKLNGKLNVAPLAGAWIEIQFGQDIYASDVVSLPSRERGLKSKTGQSYFPAPAVAPLAGAWIEMYRSIRSASAVTCRSPRGSVD